MLRKHNPNIYVNGPIELVSLVLGAVGSGCVRASLLPILFENGTLAKFGVVQLRNSEYVFLTQETHPVFGCNIRPFLPLVVDDFDNLDAFVDIVFYKSCVLDSIGTNDMHRKT